MFGGNRWNTISIDLDLVLTTANHDRNDGTRDLKQVKESVQHPGTHVRCIIKISSVDLSMNPSLKFLLNVLRGVAEVPWPRPVAFHTRGDPHWVSIADLPESDHVITLDTTDIVVPERRQEIIVCERHPVASRIPDVAGQRPATKTTEYPEAVLGEPEEFRLRIVLLKARPEAADIVSHRLERARGLGGDPTLTDDPEEARWLRTQAKWLGRVTGLLAVGVVMFAVFVARPWF